MICENGRVMSQPPAPFALAFDCIELDPANAPSRQAIEHALALCAPELTATAPGFYLLDDCGGRFEIDAQWGVVSLKDDAVLQREAGEVHAARLLIIEASGARYDLVLRLRLTGHIPQMLGGEENDFLLGPAA